MMKGDESTPCPTSPCQIKDHILSSSNVVFVKLTSKQHISHLYPHNEKPKAPIPNLVKCMNPQIKSYQNERGQIFTAFALLPEIWLRGGCS